MSVARRIQVGIVGPDDTAGRQVPDAFDRIADEVGQFVLGQPRGVRPGIMVVNHPSRQSIQYMVGGALASAE
jgi:hypothetical protein